MAIILPIAHTIHPLIFNETLGFYVDAPEFTEQRLRTVLSLRARFLEHQNAPRAQAMLKRVTVIVAMNTVIYMMIIVWEFTVGIFVPDINRVVQHNMMMTVSDMLSFSMPYTLLICDKNVQEMMWQKVPRISRMPSSIVPIS
ncbi:unnamed protein product [Caenorhabditis angaria]|uniref:Serpentine receptor class gamma n=1 Tax=Caenorhabditis angaria TaxID=860376 RepID=A0A9P1IRX2_9PELO|nr:unnamed protein product [Caenorhabditis angaria]